MSTDCPSQSDLVLAALVTEGTAGDERVARHEGECVSCRRELAQLRQVVSVLRSTAQEEEAFDARGCLDDADIARLADGLDPDRDRKETRHLIVCARCRAELGAAVEVLHDTTVAAELKRLDAPARQWRGRGSRLALAGGLAAAALAGLVLWPAVQPQVVERSTESEALRERTITTTAAPRIVSPVIAATGADTLRWTSVPTADVYRVTFWRTDGTVVWQADVRDTVHAMPPEIISSGERSLLWEVQARTGWDRWVTSDMAEINLTPTGAR